MFVDSARIRVRAGDGGNGCVSFRREKYVPRGGPDGGDGGRGGDVILIAREGYRTLYDCHQRRLWRAGRGAHGSGANRHGRDGTKLFLPVPPGTVVSDVQTGEVLADLVRPNEQFVAARGGRGGRGNAWFKSPTNRAPRTAQPGQPGETKQLLLTLKVLADIALVGLPNAGKSSLISAVSGAHPKIADYPFTTTEPNLGVLVANDVFPVTIADLPGIVEGAHSGHGLGIRFLQHVQRTKLLVLVVDVSEDASIPGPQAFRILESEMGLFDASLIERIAFIAANKIDLVCPQAALEELRALCQDRDIGFFPVSAKTGEGLDKLVGAISSRMSAREVLVGT